MQLILPHSAEFAIPYSALPHPEPLIVFFELPTNRPRSFRPCLLCIAFKSFKTYFYPLPADSLCAQSFDAPLLLYILLSTAFPHFGFAPSFTHSPWLGAGHCFIQKLRLEHTVVYTTRVAGLEFCAWYQLQVKYKTSVVTYCNQKLRQINRVSMVEEGVQSTHHGCGEGNF